MIKLVVADMDGTALQPDLSLSPRTIQAIKSLQERGIHFTFATGRPDQLMKEYVDWVDLKDPIISSNGSVIANPFASERIVEIGLEQPVIEQALSYLEAHNVTYMIYTKDGILCQENSRSRFFEERNKTLPKRRQSIFIYSDHPVEMLNEDTIVNKILVIEHDEKRYKDHYKAMQQLPNVNIIQSQNQFIDINPKGVNKGNALHQLAKYYKIGSEDVVAFGDHHNDIEMIENAGIGVAMGNAIDELKAVADDVCLRNDQDGLAIWIEEHILSKQQ